LTPLCAGDKPGTGLGMDIAENLLAREIRERYIAQVEHNLS
jgi:hypothetical protein